jgi:hypothetical protein
VLTKLIVAFIVEASDGGILDGSVHPLDLTVGPWMLRLGRAVLDIAGGAGVFEGAWAQKRSPLSIASLISGTANPPAPGVVNWMPLSVSTAWIL